MDQILQDLTTTYWWVTVVFVGLLINLTSAYIKPPLDSWVGARSRRSRERSALRQSAHAERVKVLHQSSHEQVLSAITVLRHRFNFLVGLVLAVLLLVISSFVKTMPPAFVVWPLNISLKTAFSIIDASALFLAAVQLLVGVNELRAASLEAAALADARKPDVSTDETLAKPEGA